ncbi:hypothetical protein HMPREF9005_1168 [Actinomyces sp. oral taxon 178 str. F0338]|nr:hypothetical protein HMPREF9005_1168 [Actinomyces sp. oral taxon 178 str. F0338]
MRGKQAQCRDFFRVERLIPACAGKTGGTSHPGRYGTAHPRVCGENVTKPNK